MKNIPNEVASLFVEECYIQAKKNDLYDGYLAGTDGDYQKGFDPDSSVSSFTSTFNFSYTPEQFDVLSGLTKSLFIQSKDTIRDAIQQAIVRQNDAKS